MEGKTVKPEQPSFFPEVLSSLYSAPSGKSGMSLVSVLIALFILLVGILSLTKIYPVLEQLALRSQRYTRTQTIADHILERIEQLYGSEDTAVPTEISGSVQQFPGVSYRVRFARQQENLYEVRVSVFNKQEGKTIEEETVSILRQK